MKTDSEQGVARYFDECAEQGVMMTFSSAKLRKLDEALVRWNIRPGDRILEPGCGSGRLTAWIADIAGYSGEVFACDISKVMIDRALDRNLPKHVIFHHGSAASIPRADGYFDKIVCLAVFPHFTHRARTLAELYRVLKEGGDLWIEHFKSRRTINDIHTSAGGAIISHIIPDEAEMRSIISHAGFEVGTISDIDDSYYLYAVKRMTPSPV